MKLRARADRRSSSPATTPAARVSTRSRAPSSSAKDRLGESVLVAGQEFAVGDRVIARHNDRLREVDNGMRGTIVAVDPTENELLVRTDTGADRALDAAYVAQHLEHAYALTAHTMQGGTVEWAGVVGHPDDFTRNWSYTALSRARDATEIFLIDTPTEHQLDRAEIAPDHPKELVDERTPLRAPGGRDAPARRRGPRPRPHTHRQHRQRRSGRCQPPAGTRQRGRWKRAAVAVSR